MANPQKENGYIQISTELWEAISRTKLSDGEHRILCVVIRKTYGWKKKKDEISLTQFSQLAGMTRRGVCKSIDSLVNRCILARERKGTTKTTSYYVQKDYVKWSSREQKGTGEQRFTSTRERKGKKLGNKKALTKDTIQKKKEKINTVATSLATDLAQIVSSHKNIKINVQKLRSWAIDIQLLNKVDGVDYERQRFAMEWYGQNAYAKYVPVIESGRSFREKFIKIENAIKRSPEYGRAKAYNDVMEMDLSGSQEIFK